MRSSPLIALSVLLVACGGSPDPADKGGEKPGSQRPSTEAGSGGAEPPTTVAKPAGPPLPPEAPELGEHYLVILASKLDPAEVEPALSAARALGEPGARARTLLSSRYKNLMPCYHVAIADAFADKKAAFALSKTLTASGVENYVKNAGAYVGPSPAIDAFCAGFVAEDAGMPSVRIVTVAGGRAWVPASGTLPDGLPPAQRLGEDYDAWLQPVAGDPGGAEEPARWTVLDVKTGKTTSCGRKGYGALTLGTPHFGVMQAEEKPSEPACGDPALHAELDCALEPGLYVATPEGGKAPSALEPAGSGGPELEAAARAELEKVAGFRDFKASDPEGTVTRTVRVTRWKGTAGAFHVVEGLAEDGAGVCGGDEVAFRALYAAEGEGLGRRLGPFVEEHFSTLQGVLDLEGDGAPELFTTAFPDERTAWRSDGAELSRSSIAFCDCAC